MVLETFPRTLKGRQIHPFTEYEYTDEIPMDRVERSFLEIDDFEKLVGALLSSLYSTSEESSGGPSFRCNTEFKPYQFRPLLKYQKNDQDRILIADETGLGKTIEAGYILVEELARQDLNRVLILTPAHLRYKWKGELWNRFGLDFQVIKSGRQLRSMIDRKKRFYGVASMELASSLEADSTGLYLQDSELDMLMIDEIHRMIGREGETNRRKLGLSLSLISDRCIGITAAPVQIDIYDLKRIFDIVYPGRISEDEFEKKVTLASKLNEIYWILSKNPLDEGDKRLLSKKMKSLKDDFDISEFGIDKKQFLKFRSDIQDFIENEIHELEFQFRLREETREINPLTSLYTMSKAIEVGEARTRDIENIKVSLDDESIKGYQSDGRVEISEKDLFGEVKDLLEDSFSGPHLFQLSSCLPAMLDLMRKGMEGFTVWNPDKNRFEGEENPLSEDMRNRCKILADRYGLIKKDTKWTVLVDRLEDMKKEDRKTIVFTQWRPTLRYFDRKRRQLDFKTFLISSEDDNYTRKEKSNAFQNHDGFSVLFTTDILSEGIDLQDASAVINYDLPTNPQTIEQRIGRVDRVGQERKSVKVMNIIVENGKDEEWLPKIKARLEEQREGVGFSRSIFENIDKDFIEDKDEVMNLLRERYRQELKEEVILWGVDDVLDEDIKSRHEELKRRGYDLRWTCLRNMFKAISGEDGIQMDICDQGEKARLTNVKDFDISVIKDVLRKKHERKVIGDFKNHREADMIDLDLGVGDMEGLDIPFHHPLFRKSVSISKYGFCDGSNDGLEIRDVFKISSDDKKEAYKRRFLILVEAKLELMEHTEQDYFWFSIGERLKRLDDFSLDQLYRDYDDDRIQVCFDSFETEIDIADLKKNIGSDLEGWFEKKYESLKSSILMEKERKSNVLNRRLDKEDSDGERKNTPKNHISKSPIQNKLEGLDIEIESLKDDIAETESDLKVLAMFLTGTKN